MISLYGVGRRGEIGRGKGNRGVPPGAGRRYRAEEQEIQPSRQLFKLLQSHFANDATDHPPPPPSSSLNFWTNERSGAYHTCFSIATQHKSLHTRMSLKPPPIRKALGIALERLWTSNLFSFLPHTPPPPQIDRTDRQITGYPIYASIPLCPTALYHSILSTHNLWHAGFRSNSRLQVHLRCPLYSFSFRPSVMVHCLIVVHRSFPTSSYINSTTYTCLP